MTDDELKAIEAWASKHVTPMDTPHQASEENWHRDQTMALIAEIRRLQENIDDMRNAAIERGESA